MAQSIILATHKTNKILVNNKGVKMRQQQKIINSLLYSFSMKILDTVGNKAQSLP